MSSSAIAEHDAQKMRTGTIHRTKSHRKITARRNRQTLQTACGRQLNKALPVDVRVDGETCRKCWPELVPVNFTREIRCIPGYDHRDDPDPKKRERGAHGMEIMFILVGAPGYAITAKIMTTWQSNPLSKPFPGIYKYDFDKHGPLERERRAGTDSRAPGWTDDPMGGPVCSHSHTKDRDYWSGPGPCDILGGECYGDMGFLMGDTFKDALIRGGDEGAWKYLEEVYKDWFGPEDDE